MNLIRKAAVGLIQGKPKVVLEVSCTVHKRCFAAVVQYVRATDVQSLCMTVGILLLDSIHIRKQDKAALGAAIDQGHLEPLLSMHAPATAVVWLFTSPQPSSKGRAQSSCAAGSTEIWPQMVQHAEKDLGPALMKPFDVLLICDEDPEWGADNSSSSSASMQHTAHDGPAQSSRAPAAGYRQTLNSNSELQHLLRHRLATSASMQSPEATEEAMAMIQQYYAFIRQQDFALPASCRDVGPHTLVSLLRMATSCARLHLRHDVLPMPDVVVAIFLLQESLKAQVSLLAILDLKEHPAVKCVPLLSWDYSVFAGLYSTLDLCLSSSLPA